MTYDESYFDSGKRKQGRFGTYSFERLYPSQLAIAHMLVQIKSSKKMLDVGCAKGYLVQAFRDSGVEGYGIDISEYAITQASASIRENLSVVDVATQDLRFPDGSMDLVTAVGSLDYVRDVSHALSEIRRVLKKDGLLFVTVACNKKGDSYRVTAVPESEWVGMIENSGFVFQRDLTRANFWSFMQIFLGSATSTRARVVSILVNLPVVSIPVRSYLRGRFTILFFAPTRNP
jgi:ubiquinone/menaquinone biosynthesis C-methylase UbiE